MTEQPRHRARLSLGYFDTPEMARQAVLEAQSKLCPTASQGGLREAIAPDPIEIPANANLVTEKPLHLTLDRWLYASDFHVPLHNRPYIKRMVLVAQRRKVDTLIIGGDLFDFDSSSRHPKTERQAGLNETLRIGGDLLVALCAVFDRVYVLPGNHCRRVATKLDEPLEFDALIHAALKGRVAFGKVVTTDYDYIRINDWIVGHPKFYSSKPAQGVAHVAQLQQCNVIGAHNHIVGVSQSADGKWIAVDPGHMTDPDLTPYYLQSAGLSKYPAWKNGFVVVDNGIPTLYADGLVDWKVFE